MAKIIKTTDEIIKIDPENNKNFSLKELQKIVDGSIEIVTLPDNNIMVLNEQGKLEGLPINEIATNIFQIVYDTNDFIVGNVLICNTNQVE